MTAVYFIFWTTIGLAAGMLVAELVLIPAFRSGSEKSYPATRFEPDAVSVGSDRTPSRV